MDRLGTNWTRSVRRVALGLLTILAIILYDTPALNAQHPAPSKDSAAALSMPNPAFSWQLDLSGVWFQAGPALKGVSALPSPSPLVPLSLGFPQQTRFVSSWFFGSGAALIEEIDPQHVLARTPVHPLDAVLTGRSAAHQSGAGISLALTRVISGRFGAEFRVSSSRTGVGITPTGRNEIESSRKSFEEFFGRVTSLVGGDPSTSRAVVDTVPGSRLEVQASAGLRTSFRKTPFGVPYVTVGGGLICSNRSWQQVAITGRYQFSAPDGRTGLIRQYDEVDAVVVQIDSDRYRPFWTGGVGTTFSVSPRVGFQIDTRFSQALTQVSLTLNASPGVAVIDDPDLSRSGVQTVGVGAIKFDDRPVTVLMFDNNRQLSGTFPSSLSGPRIEHFRTLTARGTESVVALSFGMYLKF